MRGFQAFFDAVMKQQAENYRRMGVEDRYANSWADWTRACSVSKVKLGPVVMLSLSEFLEDYASAPEYYTLLDYSAFVKIPTQTDEGPYYAVILFTYEDALKYQMWRDSEAESHMAAESTKYLEEYRVMIAQAISNKKQT